MTSKETLVSYILLSYNQEKFIRAAIKSALAQSYEPLEIIISDDCSTDQTYNCILDETKDYQGPHIISLNRNESNFGLARNLNYALKSAKGAFFVLSAGDDISVPDRTEILVNRWQELAPSVDMICSYFAEIDVHGNHTGYIKKYVLFVPDTTKKVPLWTCGATGACVGFSRKLYDKYGPLHPDVVAEDWIFSFRAWLESGIELVEMPLVDHRTHDDSISVRFRNKKLRNVLRKSYDFGLLARAKEWSRAWEIAGRGGEKQIVNEFQQWINALELICSTYDSSKSRALKAAFLSLRYEGGIRNALKILRRMF